MWFLRSNKDFTNRKLEIGCCPECFNHVVRLTEKRLIDGKVFPTIYTRSKAEKVISACENEIEYTNLDILSKKGTPFGFRYGENIEKVNKKTGERIKIEKACDFYGNKETIRVITANNIQPNI